MKIVSIIPNLASGGAERFVVDLCNELSKNNEVHLITLYDSDNSEFLRNYLHSEVNTHSLNKSLGFDFKIITRLFKIINRLKPDIVHSHLSSLNYLLPIVPLLRKTSFVHTIHNDAFKESRNKLIRKIRSVYYRNKLIQPVTISSESNRSFNEAYKKNEARLILNGRVYPNKSYLFSGAKDFVESLKSSPNTAIFTTIGRFETQKNQLMLVNSFNRFLKHYPDSKLLIIGGERNSEVSMKIKSQLESKVSSNVILLGELENATDYLHLADFFCLSSIHEGMPITLIESFACGCIPICTPVGGMKEMIDKIDPNLLSKSTSEEDYLSSMIYSASLDKSHKELLKKEIKNSYENSYSMTICAKKYTELFTEIKKTHR